MTAQQKTNRILRLAALAFPKWWPEITSLKVAFTKNQSDKFVIITQHCKTILKIWAPYLVIYWARPRRSTTMVNHSNTTEVSMWRSPSQKYIHICRISRRNEDTITDSLYQFQFAINAFNSSYRSIRCHFFPLLRRLYFRLSPAILKNRDDGAIGNYRFCFPYKRYQKSPILEFKFRINFFLLPLKLYFRLVAALLNNRDDRVHRRPLLLPISIARAFLKILIYTLKFWNSRQQILKHVWKSRCILFFLHILAKQNI